VSDKELIVRLLKELLLLGDTDVKPSPFVVGIAQSRQLSERIEQARIDGDSISFHDGDLIILEKV
jgi:hypothetical protein